MLEVKLDCVGDERVKCNKQWSWPYEALFVIYTCSDSILPTIGAIAAYLDVFEYELENVSTKVNSLVWYYGNCCKWSSPVVRGWDRRSSDDHRQRWDDDGCGGGPRLGFLKSKILKVICTHVMLSHMKYNNTVLHIFLVMIGSWQLTTTISIIICQGCILIIILSWNDPFYQHNYTSVAIILPRNSNNTHSHCFWLTEYLILYWFLCPMHQN